jgi:catechol 2,3-dioxygenase-like lactoylglutathione lyase family enzyme
MKAIHHLAIPVQSVQRAVDWYCSIFGARIIYQDESWAMLRFRNIDLAFVIPDQHPPHVAIEHPHAEIFGELTTHRDGTSSVYIKDTEGNAVEILSQNSNTTTSIVR